MSPRAIPPSRVLLTTLLATLLVASLTVVGSAGASTRLQVITEGSSAVEVAIAYSRVTFPDGGVASALLARDDLFADALASGGLQQDGPLLLTPGDALDDDVAAELERLGVTEVVLMGGEAAISPAVEEALRDAGLDVRRIEGDTRIGTAAAAAGELPQATTALLVRAFDSGSGDASQAFADALAAGAWAASAGIPVLLTDSVSLSGETSAHLASSGITNVVVLGGESAVGEQVLDDVRSMGIDVTRVAGDTRFATATAALAAQGVTAADATTVLVVEGQTADAWTRGFPAAAYVAQTGAALVLANSDQLPAETTAWLTSAGTDVTIACAANASACDAAEAVVSGGSDVAPDLSAIWIIGEGETSPVVEAGSLVNVQSVSTETIDGVDYLLVEATGLPSYDPTIDEEMLEELTSRPRADSDFDDGEPTVGVGDTVVWGQDVGYVNDQCDVGAGQGYWPPGPACPSTQETQAYFPLSPTMAADGEESEGGLGKLGLWVNGVSIYGWGDGMSYENGGVWQNLAPVFEVYDLDICDGHAAMGDYHHHNDADCLAEQLDDTGTGHSPVYGVAADGYPVYGPWVAEGVLARSSWVVRGYDDPDSETGCGTSGARTCLLVDRLDPSAGTVPTIQQGPDTTDLVTTASGNVLTALAGSYFEDYYYDASLNDGTLPALDEHNGHDHDGLGYHYHVTLEEQADGHLANVFPYFIGETFAGVLADNAVAVPGQTAPGGGPGDGGPPPGLGELPPPGQS